MAEEVVTRFRSKLGPFEDEIRSLKASGMSTREIAAEMQARHSLAVSHNAVASFMRTHRMMRRNFFDGIAETRRGELMQALKAMWTHDSTAIEGNTLSLGDTIFVLQYGLTVKGKSLKDHDDVIAHAHGVDIVMKLADRGKVTAADVKELHRTAVVREIEDIYKPIGDWKREDNGTYNSEGGRPVYMAYAAAEETPQLMADWIREFNSLFEADADEETALDAYLRAHVSFVRIHPFFDGNGRLARLLANLPVLYAGHVPIVVPSEARAEYIRALWTYQRAVGPISLASPALLPEPERLEELKALLRTWWRPTIELVAEARLEKGK